MKRGRGLHTGLLLALILLALGLRVYHLAAQSLWYDEAVTAQVASQGVAELTRWTADDIQPPLYYYAVAGWTRLAGRSEWALRWVSVFFGVLTVPLLWALARRLFGRSSTGAWAGILAGLFAALSPLYVYYSQEARMYTLLTFLGGVAGYALLRANAADQPAGNDPEGRVKIGTGSVGARRISSPIRTLTAHRQGGDNQGGHKGRPYVVTTTEGEHRDTVRLRWWLGFVLAAVAVLYTHYFGAFLLLAFALCWLLAWGSRWVRARRAGLAVAGLRHDLGLAAAAGVAVIVLYLPWLPAMLTRYQVDRSYWQGSLKLGEALRHVAVSFAAAAPETALEAQVVPLLPWFGLALLVALAALVWRSRRENSEPRAGVLFVLVSLLVPVLGILALASRTPKFNARYLMLASPAYLLWLAGGAASLVTWLPGRHSRISRTASAGAAARPGPVAFAGHTAAAGDGDVVLMRALAPSAAPMVSEQPQAAGTGSAGLAARPSAVRWLSLAAGLAIVALVAVVSVQSLGNWFASAAFTKAQWRQAGGYIRSQLAPGETVLLVSGHASPAWDYYAPDIPRIREPDIDVLDVNDVLGFATGPDLQAHLAGHTGVWVVFWQASAVDPVGFVPYYLGRAGREQPVKPQFWQLTVRHWTLDPAATYPATAQPQHADGANFRHKVALLGWDAPANGQLTLYWKALNDLNGTDYQVSLHFEDAAGNELPQRYDGRPVAYGYPTGRWPVGAALFGRYSVPAGAVRASIAVYDSQNLSGLDIMDQADNPAGKRVTIGPFTQ